MSTESDLIESILSAAERRAAKEQLRKAVQINLHSAVADMAREEARRFVRQHAKEIQTVMQNEFGDALKKAVSRLVEETIASAVIQLRGNTRKARK